MRREKTLLMAMGKYRLQDHEESQLPWFSPGAISETEIKTFHCRDEEQQQVGSRDCYRGRETLGFPPQNLVPPPPKESKFYHCGKLKFNLPVL